MYAVLVRVFVRTRVKNVQVNYIAIHAFYYIHTYRIVDGVLMGIVHLDEPGVRRGRAARDVDAVADADRAGWSGDVRGKESFVVWVLRRGGSVDVWI